jgi:hypothetical protein
METKAISGRDVSQWRKLTDEGWHIISRDGNKIIMGIERETLKVLLNRLGRIASH